MSSALLGVLPYFARAAVNTSSGDAQIRKKLLLAHANLKLIADPPLAAENLLKFGMEVAASGDASSLNSRALDGWSKIGFAAEADSPFSADRLAGDIAKGLEFFGAISQEVPGVGLALTLAGILAEPTLKYLAKPGLNLMESPFPPPDIEHFQNVSATALLLTDSAAASDSTIGQLMAKPQTALTLGIDFDASNESLLANIPASLKELVRKALSENGDQVQQDVTVAVQQFVTQQLSSYADKIDSNNKLLKDMQYEQERQNEKQVQAASLARDVSEIKGAVQIADFVLRGFVDDTTANKITAVAMKAIEAGVLIAQFVTNAIGSFALGGGLLGVASSLISIFSASGGPDPVMLAHFQRIENAIKDLKDFVDRKFEEVAAREIAIIEKLRDIYDQIVNGQLALQTQINDVYALILTDIIENDKFERVNKEADFRSNISACYQHLTTINASDAWRAQFGQFLNRLKNHAVQTSKLPYYTHGDNDPQIRQQLLQTRRTDLFFGWIANIATVFNVPLKSQYRAAGNDLVIPNPIAWAEGTHSYLCAASLAQNSSVPGQKQHLLDMWTEGMRIRETVRLVRSQEFTDSAMEAYSFYAGKSTTRQTLDRAFANLARTGKESAEVPTPPEISQSPKTLLDFLHTVFRSFCQTKQLFVDIKKTVVEQDGILDQLPLPHARYNISYPFNSVTKEIGLSGYPSRIGWHTKMFFVDPDPFDLCIQKGMLKFRTVPPKILVFGDRHPASGQDLPDSLYVFRPVENGLYISNKPFELPPIKYDEFGHFALPSNAEVAAQARTDEDIINKFLNLCFDLIVYADSNIVKTEFPTYFDNVLQTNESSNLFSSFENAALALWHSAAIKNWTAQSRDVEKYLSKDVAAPSNSVIIGSLGQMPGIVSIQSFGALVRRLTQVAPRTFSELSSSESPASGVINRNFNWSFFFEESLRAAFEATIAQLQIEDLSRNDRSLNIVDDVLMELMGFMALNKIELPAIIISG